MAIGAELALAHVCTRSGVHHRDRSIREMRFMADRRFVRRSVSVVLMVIGGLVMLLSASVGAGLVAFSLGVLVELVGLALERRPPR
jgi:Zn-dependent membrane protease YugP